MKLTLFLLSALAVNFCCAFPTTVSNIFEELKQFADLFPEDEAMQIINEYSATDEDVQKLVSFRNSEDIKKFILGLESVKEFQQILRLFQTHGFDVYELMRSIHIYLNLPSFVPPVIYSLRKTGQGVKGLIHDLEAILPEDDIKRLSEDKRANNEEYREFYDLMNSDIYKKLYCQCEASKAFQREVEIAKEKGFDLHVIVEFILKVLNIDMVRC